jgi:hypothetical protein
VARRNRSIAITFVLVALGGPVAAQEVADSAGVRAAAAPARRDTARGARDGWVIGASVGLPGTGAQAAELTYFTIGVHWTDVHPGRLGADLSVGTIPRAFVEGLVVFGLRAGVALPLLVTRNVLVLPSGGVSLVGIVGPGGGGGTGGFNTGVAAVFFGSSSLGFRTGVTWHRFQDAPRSVWLLELGIVGARGRSR